MSLRPEGCIEHSSKRGQCVGNAQASGSGRSSGCSGHTWYHDNMHTGSKLKSQSACNCRIVAGVI